MMVTNRAAWQTAEKAYPFEIKEAPMYTPGADQILLKVHTIGINIIDFKLQQLAIYPLRYPTILGEDVAGEVVAVGANITRVKPGDRVLGVTAGFVRRTIEHQGFQEYCLLEHNLMSPIPDSLSFEKAVALPVCASTAAAFLFEKDFLNLQLPTLPARPSNGQTVLVSGGASALGSNVIQLAVASGYEVITTASPKNHDILKHLGAAQVLDYNLPSHADDLVAACKGKKIVGVLDSIGKQACQPLIDFAVKSGQTKFIGTCTPGWPPAPEGIEIKHVMGISIMNNHIGKAIFEDFLPKALQSGDYAAFPPPHVVGKGLESIQAGVDQVAKGVSAQKLVVQI